MVQIQAKGRSEAKTGKVDIVICPQQEMRQGRRESSADLNVRPALVSDGVIVHDVKASLAKLTGHMKAAIGTRKENSDRRFASQVRDLLLCEPDAGAGDGRS
jgi:hypothetical protein